MNSKRNWNRKEETVAVGEMRELEIQRKNKRIKWAIAKEREEKSDGEEKREVFREVWEQNISSRGLCDFPGL